MWSGYIIGIIWGLYLKNISIVLLFCIFGAILLILYKLTYIKLQKLKTYKFCILSFIIFAIISNIQITILESKFDNLYNGLENIQCIATVISGGKETSYKASYTVKVESINDDKKYEGTNLIIYTSKSKKLEYGEKIIIEGTYTKAKAVTNYKAFDYREYLKTKNVYGILNVKNISTLKKNNLDFISMKVNEIRTNIKENLQEILGKESEVTKRNTATEILLTYQKKQ